MGRSVYDPQYVTLHGHRRAYVKAGRGPVVLLVHGLACDHHTWDPVIRKLSRHFTVIAPDLLGHGESAKPRADYSVPAYANGMRDLLSTLEIERASIVGHSFGGGVAMQFAYQFPERTERVALVSSGGLGPEVSPVIRSVTAPFSGVAARIATLPGVRHAGAGALRLASRVPGPVTRDLGEVAKIWETFVDPAGFAAVRQVVRGAVDWRGQVVTMADRAYLAGDLPMCVIWGRQDLVIPASHAERAVQLKPSCRLEIFDNCGHFPHRDHPDRFAHVLKDFLTSSTPYRHSEANWLELLRAGLPDAPEPLEDPALDAEVAGA